MYTKNRILLWHFAQGFFKKDDKSMFFVDDFFLTNYTKGHMDKGRKMEMKYSVVYTSPTGNTQQLAQEIRAALPQEYELVGSYMCQGKCRWQCASAMNRCRTCPTATC